MKRLLYASLIGLILIAMVVGIYPAHALTNYQVKLSGLAGNLIAYWPLADTSGTTAIDVSGYARNGTYSGVTLNNSTGPDGGPVPLWDGVNDYLTLPQASLTTAFNGQAGSLIIWLKVAGAGVWTDSTLDQSVRLYVDASNSIAISKATIANTLRMQYIAGGTTETYDYSTSTTDWLCIGMTWNKAADTVRYYAGGSAVGTSNTLGTWTGSLSNTFLSGGTNAWNGWLAHYALWSAVFDESTMNDACDTSIPPTPTITPTYTPTKQSYYAGELDGSYGYQIPLQVTAGDILQSGLLLLLGGLIIGSLILIAAQRK